MLEKKNIPRLETRVSRPSLSRLLACMAVVGLCWPSLAVVGLHWNLAFVSCHSSVSSDGGGGSVQQ